MQRKAVDLFPISPEIVEEYKRRETEVGYKMSDGTICAGISLDTQRPIYVAVNHARQLLPLGQAIALAEAISQDTGHSYRVPTSLELRLIFKNRAAVLRENFSIKAPDATWYWSSTLLSKMKQAVAIRFSDGKAGAGLVENVAMVLLVRD